MVKFLKGLITIDFWKVVLAHTIWQNSVKSYLIALAIFAVVFTALRLFKKFGIKKLTEWASKTKIEFDDLIVKLIERIHWPFYVVLSLYISMKFIKVAKSIDKFMYGVLLILAMYYIVSGIQKFIEYSTSKYVAKRQKDDKEVDETTVQLLSKIAALVLWILSLLIILQNLGYNINTLVASLGVGGIVVGLSLQNIVSDIFASVSIHLDRPFKVGHFIIVGKDMGVVMKVGIKSTRLKTLQGQELVIPNKQLTDERINNYKKMQKRRIAFGFGVTYETPKEKVKSIPDMIKNFFKSIEGVELDRAHFKSFGAYSLDCEVVYYILTGDYNLYMDKQQEINLALMEVFEKEKIEFAYPRQDIKLVQ